MVFWGKPLASPRESPRAPGENGKRALHFCAVDEDFVRVRLGSGLSWEVVDSESGF
uniref:SnRNP core protein SMX5a n=1 Tax=Mus musculus TaxID=10090 RepID=Q9ES86_MOUSE|nr:snRNP core protein SMX5a [Mus musculus]